MELELIGGKVCIVLTDEDVDELLAMRDDAETEAEPEDEGPWWERETNQTHPEQRFV